MSDEFYDDEERHKVWIAMSDLFLDTELTPIWLESLSKTLAASPFSIDELVHIYELEVAPIFHVNLHCVAGVWGGFKNEAVIDLVRKRLVGLKGKKNIMGIPPIAALKRWYYLSLSEREWKIVLDEVCRLRIEQE